MTVRQKPRLKFLNKSLERLRSQFSFPVDFQLVNVLDHTIYRCLGCDTCPAGGRLKPGQVPSAKQHGECIIQNPEDAMHKLHMEMLKLGTGRILLRSHYLKF